MRLFCFFILFSFLSFNNCSIEEEFVDLKNLKTFKSKHVFFQYPGNWGVEKDGAANMHYTTYTIKSTRSSFITLQHYNRTEEINVRNFFETYSKEVNLQQIKIQKVHRFIINKKLEGLKNQFDKKILGFLVPHLNEFYVINNHNQTLTIVTQTPKEDSKNILKGFDLVLSTLYFGNSIKNK